MAPTETYTLSLHDALPISGLSRRDETAAERVRQGTAEDEPARLRSEDDVRGARTRPGSELVDRLAERRRVGNEDRKSTRLNSSHQIISYAVFCLKKKNRNN